MQKFISCDWGTSSLRLRVIETGKMCSLAETVSEQGILSVFSEWKQSGKPESERLSFYQSMLAGEIRRIGKQLDFSLEDMPLIVSGMASSSIGMVELPYAEILPGTHVHDLNTKKMEATNDFRHSMLVVSGIKKDNDVMRGEETQLIGCLDKDKEDQLFIFPGTHSKHINIRNGNVVDFTTFMTGEFFELLSKKSILSGSVEESKDMLDGSNIASFEAGVAAGCHLNLLHSSFLVRTNSLFNKLSKQENYCYLSGLLIGTELRYVPGVKMPLTIVSDPALTKLYNAALQKLGAHKVRYCDAGIALIAGHCKLHKIHG